MTNKILRKSYWTLLVFWAIAVTALICVSFQSIKRKPRMIADSIGNYFNEKGLIDHLKPPELRNNIWPSPRHSRNHIIEDRNITQSRIEYNKRLGAIVEGSAGHGVDPKVIERIKAQYGYPHDEKGKFLPPFLIAQMNSVTVTKNERKERDSANQNDPFTFKNVAVPKNQSQQKAVLRGAEAKAFIEAQQQSNMGTSNSKNSVITASDEKEVQGRPKPNGKARNLLSGKSVTSDVKGNLGPPSVVTNENIADWLKDRWQAASDMGGTPIPGPHYLQIDLGELCRIESIFIDFETAYSKYWTLYGRRSDNICPKHKNWVQLAQGTSGKPAKGIMKQHVHQTVPVVDLSTGDGGENDCDAPNYTEVKLVILRPSTRFGTSIWRLHINGIEL